jgi:hypothetical protein
MTETKRRRLGLAATGSFPTLRRSAAARFSGFPSKARVSAAQGDLIDASWLDGGARVASEQLGDDGRLESNRRRDLVL